MNIELNHFTQLFMLAGFYHYLYPVSSLGKFDFVTDWIFQPFLPFPEVVIYDYDRKLRVHYINPLYDALAPRLRADNN